LNIIEILDVNEKKMTTKFKVVEVYRNNSSCSNGETKVLNNSSLNDSVDLSSSNLIENAQNSMLNTFGFNLIGGYSTSIPVTVNKVLVNNSNFKSAKVILEH